MDQPTRRSALFLPCAIGALVGFAVADLKSVVGGLIVAVAIAGTGLGLARRRERKSDVETVGETDATAAPVSGSEMDRRRFLTAAGAGAVALTVSGPALGWGLKHISRPDTTLAQEAMARGLGSEYMELMLRGYHPERAGDLQLVLAPFNSSNYTFESTSLVPNDPRTSHAAVWMYLERIPLVVYGPGIVEPGDSTERVSLADLAPTTADLIGFDAWPDDRDGRSLPGVKAPAKPPKVVVTFVIDGGGWNVLSHWGDTWPNLRRLMREGRNYRNAIHGSFPAVTACGHATIGTGAFPDKHGISGHNIRVNGQVRKAYGETAGKAEPGDIMLPTLADLWSDETRNRAWVGQIGYQVWHLGMMGFGGRGRGADQKPVGIYFEEAGNIHDWRPHNPDYYRLPAGIPGKGTLDMHKEDFIAPTWDEQFAPVGRQQDCCAPPIVKTLGDVIEATIENEALGAGGVSDLLYINYKMPDYTGHIYNMLSRWEGLVFEEVDAQLGRLVEQLDHKFPGEYVLIVTADHGQCPLPDAEMGVRLDPIQLQGDIEAKFNGFTGSVTDYVAPAEIFLDARNMVDNGWVKDADIAAYLRDYRYSQNIGSYVRPRAIQRDLLNKEEFAAVFSGSYLRSLSGTDVSRYGRTRFTGADEFSSNSDGLPPLP